ncbi:MAG TPA: hypothetical protein VN673_16640, partial [Clostridia bacterium]|nr:hypothetical protein [Clostridia bacterium]
NNRSDVVSYGVLTAVLLPDAGGQGPWLTWPFVPGNEYEVEYKGWLETGWQTLPGTITNLANKAWFQDAVGIGQRFYRIRAF